MKQLKISGKDYKILKTHLLPDDGKEAIAFALCGTLQFEDSQHLLVHKVFTISHHMCKRTDELIEWPISEFEPILDEARRHNYSILKIHSHPNGFSEFSRVDNVCDKHLFRSIHGWCDNSRIHASAVMLPDGSIFGRFISEEQKFEPIDRVSISGDVIQIWDYNNDLQLADIDNKNLQAFGERTTKILKKLKVGVVGCSGTGSPIIEQLVRLGVGHIIIVDDDKVEKKNLNRILNTIEEDAINERYKVDVIKERLSLIGFGNTIEPIKSNICEDKQTLLKLATCDILVGCTDTVESRHYSNHLSTFYLVPYFDLGVMLRVDEQKGISKIAGAIHYLQPGGSSLLSREVYTLAELDAESLRRTNPEQYEKLIREKYLIGGGAINSPAVISVNMQIAAMAMNEILNKIDPFKSNSEDDNAIVRILITDNLLETESDGIPDKYLSKKIGLGDTSPFIGIIGL